MSRFLLGSVAARALLCAACGLFLVPAFLRAQTANGTAQVRHAPTLNGTVEGSVQQMLGESAVLNSGARVTLDWLVPGTPNVVLNGSVNYGGTVNGTGSSSPTGYSLTLNTGATLGRVVRRTNAVPLPTVSAPPTPPGTRSVTVNTAGQSVGDWATLRHLTLNSNVGNYAVPAGAYGNFLANGGGSFTLGVAGATQPSTYSFQSLTLNSSAQLRAVGPVIVTVGGSFTTNSNGYAGAVANPSWLTLKLSAGGVTLNSTSHLYGYVTAPNGTVIVNSNCTLVGGVICDRLTVNSGGTLRVQPFQAANQAPTANAQSLNTPEDTARTLTLSGSDPEGAALTYTIVTPPAHGTISPSLPQSLNPFTYTPAANYAGADAFTFKVNDGALDSAPATVTITVTPVNDTPEADPKNVTTVEDAPLAITLTGLDIEGSTLSFSVTAPPAHGTLSATSGSPLTYTPMADFFGLDQFSYVVNDGSVSSFPAIVAIAVTPVNDAPVATPREVTTDEETDVATALSGSDVDGDALSFAIVTPPAHGQLLGAAPALGYRPEENFAQTDTFTFRVFDGVAWSAPATFTIHVNNLNDIPAAASRSLALAEDSPASFALSGSDPDGDPLTFTLLTAPAHGTLSAGGSPITAYPASGLASGALVYTPDADFDGSDAFTFRTSDAVADSPPATVAITVQPVNDRPVANPQEVATNEDAPVELALTGSDVDGDALAFVIIVPPQHGTLTPVAPGSAEFTYQPAPDYFGADSFAFVARDAALDSPEIVVPITVQPVNDAPVATGGGAATPEDIAVTLTLMGADVDHDAGDLAFAVETLPSFGTLAPSGSDTSGPAWLYSPAENYHGADTFTFVVTDPDGLTSGETTFTLAVTPVHDAPVPVNLALETGRDTPLLLTLQAVDADGDPLTYTVGSPLHGTLAPVDPQSPIPAYIYTPPPGFADADDSFAFTVSDGVGDPVAGTVAIHVIETNHPPTAESATLLVTEDEPRTFVLGGADPDPADVPNLAFLVLDQPQHGGLSGLGANLTYAPDANYHGADSFTFQTWDGIAYSAPATIGIIVAPVNDVPVADAAAFMVEEDGSVEIELTGSDLENDALTYTVVTSPAHGTLLAVTNPQSQVTFRYTPDANFAGADTFTFRVNDGDLDSAAAFVAITVTPVNDPPEAGGLALETFVNAPLAFTFPATDVDGDALTVTPAAPQLGTLAPAGPQPLGTMFTYTPPVHAPGSDAITFTVSDGVAAATGTVTIAIINRAPVAADSAVAIAEDTPTEITLAATDPDGQPLTYTIINPPAHGSLVPVTNPASPITYLYSPAANSYGPDSFAFVANDGFANSNVATVTITIDATNDAPTVADFAVTTTPNRSVELVVPAVDADGDPLTITFDAPAHGFFEALEDPLLFAFVPEPNFAGSETVAFTVSDGIAPPVIATLTITVENQVPVATDVEVSLLEDIPTLIDLSSSWDPDGQPITYTIITPPVRGTLTHIIHPESIAYFLYEPFANQHGADSFTFVINDGYADSAPAAVAISVESANDAPETADLALTTYPNTAVEFTVAATDADGDPLTIIFAPPAHGTITPASTSTFHFVPAGDFAGTDATTFTVSDGIAPVVTAALTITVENRAPTAADTAVTILEDTPAEITLAANDPDGQPLTYTIITPPAHGSLVAIPNPPSAITIHYTPAANFHGPDSFAFRVNDGYTDSNLATVTLTIDPVNDSPVADAQSVEVAADQSTPITLTGSDVEADPLTFTITTPPAHGTLSGVAPSVIYTPTTGFTGSDSFAFTVSDGALGSVPEIVALTVVRLDGPVITSQPVTSVRLPFSRTNDTNVEFSPIELTPTQVGSLDGSRFTTLPTANPALFGLTGSNIRRVNFDTTPAGAPIPSGAVLTNEYGSIGVLMNGITVSSSVYGGPASAPNATWSNAVQGIRLEFTFTVPVVAVGVINTSPDQDGIEYYSPAGTRLFLTRDQDGAPGPNYNVDRFVGARVDDGNLIGKIVLVNASGNIELDEMIFEVLSDQVLPGQYTYDVDAIDPAGLPITYSLDQSPTGMVIDPLTGVIRWQPTGSDLGDFMATVRATNSEGRFATQTFVVTVVTNVPPLVDAGPDLVLLDAPTTAHLGGIVTGSQPLEIAWTVVDGPGLVTFDDEHAASVIATFAATGTYTLLLTADDGLDVAGSAITVRVGVGAVSAPDGIAAWWPFNEDGTEVVHGNHDVDTELDAELDTARVSQGLHLFGRPARPPVAAHPDLDLGASPAGFSIEFWFKSDSKRDEALLGYYGSGGRGLYLVREWFGQRLAFGVFNEAGALQSIATGDVLLATTQTWRHVAVTYDRVDGAARIFLDAVVVAEGNWGEVRASTLRNLHFGSWIDTASSFAGILDEVTLYSRPLSWPEVKAIYDADSGGKAPFDGNEPAVVDAGSDLVLAGPGAIVTLAGSVTDDGRPFGVTRARWSVTSDPVAGAVAFADPESATTTATFASVGTYVLKLTGSDGYLAPTTDLLEVRIGTEAIEPPEGLAAWWPLNGHAHELINGHHDLDFVNAADFAAAIVTTGLRLDGNNDRASVRAHADLDLGASAAGFSLDFWFRSDAKREEPLLSFYSGGGRGLVVDKAWFGQHLRVLVNGDGGVSRALETGDLLLESVPTWHHVGVSYDRPTGAARLYLDGRVVAEGNWGDIRASTLRDLHFGRVPDSGVLFSGVLDEVCLYKRPLTFAEVGAIYRAGASGHAPVDLNVSPTVDAGADVVLSGIAEVASLDGRVMDDNLPLGAPRVLWSVLMAPASNTVTFADASAAATTATFAQPGSYLLQLQAYDGLNATVSDAVEVRVGVVGAARPPGMAAWWPFNGDNFEVINGNHDAVFDYGAGFAPARVLQGLNFDGSDDRAIAAAHADLDLGSSADGFSLELWFKSSGKRDEPILSYYGAGQRGLLLERTWFGQHLRFTFYDAAGAARVMESGDILLEAIGTWRHAAATYDRATGNARLYLDGVVVAQGNWPGVAARTLLDVHFGRVPDWGVTFGGVLDEVTLYKRPLTAGEVSAIFAAGAAGKQPVPQNRAPLVDAGTDTSGVIGTAIALSGAATDDGLPNRPGVVSYEWSKVSGPGTVVFDDATVSTTTAVFGTVGTYVLRLSANDSVFVGFDTITITVTPPPNVPPVVTVLEPADGATLPAGFGTYVVARATDADGTITKVEFFQDGVKLGETTTGTVGRPDDYFIHLPAGFAVGSYTLTARATDNSGDTTTSNPAAITVITDPGTAPVVELVAPVDGGRVSAPTDVTGVVQSAVLESWVLSYRVKTADGDTPAAWTTLANGTTNVGPSASGGDPSVPAVVGQFDPTLLVNGLYELRLTGTDYAGRAVTDGPISVIVEGNMKVGAFSLAFEDLSVPVAGIPISITRTYDSRDTRVGDFGPGWHIAVNNIRVQKNTNLGLDWYQEKVGDLLDTYYFVDPFGRRLVTVTFPDGETHRFEASLFVPRSGGPVLPDNAHWATPVQTAQLVFKPIGDTTSTLAVDGDNTVHLTGFLGVDYLTQGMAGFDPEFNPTRFRLTTKDGSVFVVDERLGLMEMRDLNGNTHELRRDSSEQVTTIASTRAAPGGPIETTIEIHRDVTGRVDYITDLVGESLDYTYDAQGRLESFSDRELNVTQFRYENPNFPHYLTRIIDPRGITALRSEYDDTGRLVKQIDADGRETIFNRGVDATGRFERIKDRLGHDTTYYYDDRGNVTLKIDPEGAQTSFSYYPDSDRVRFEIDHYGNTKSFAYDARGNVTVEALGASLGDDPANPTSGFVTRTSYNDRSAPTQLTDPDGRVQTFDYEPSTSNLETHTAGLVAAGSGLTAQPSTTTFTYFADGTIDTIADAVGNLTSHTYDYAFSAAAFPGVAKRITVTVTDPAGPVGSDPSNPSDIVLRLSHTLYDAQENTLAEIATRTLPSGDTEEIVTRHRYDAENRLLATILPDGRVNETRYTSFGKEDKTLVWRSVAEYESADDTLARVISYAYDARGNQTGITYADGTSEAMAFDAGNRKLWSQDRRGYRTFFEYDDVARLTATIFPDDNDGLGAAAPSALDDPRLADNARTTTIYDLIGRVRFQIDEEGATTEFTYDDNCGCAMRRKEMIQHLPTGNLVTSYQYDNAGNVRFVTDPRDNTVETRYDALGRPSTVIYPATDEHPATQTGTTYDVLGRRVAASDQEGRLTRYRYDGLGRLVEVRQYLDQSLAASDTAFSLSPNASGVVSTRYTYDEIGNQTAQVDALDRVTRYETDALGRRVKRLLPQEVGEPTALSEVLQYDDWGNLWKRTDFAGKTTTFEYDTLNRLTAKVADPTHPSLVSGSAIARIEYDHDDNGAREAARTYGAGGILLYSETTPHDARGRLDAKQTAGGMLDYSYYENGQLQDVVSSNPDGVNLGYRYDSLNRLAFVDDLSGNAPSVRKTGYSYNANGSLENVTYANGVTHAYQYDALNRLRFVNVSNLQSQVLRSQEYKPRASGHRREVLEGPAPSGPFKTTTYEYDALYRLTGETIAGSPYANNGTITYDLDKVGNRHSRVTTGAELQLELPSSTSSYNARDWLSSDDYDANGNTLSGALPSVLGPLSSGFTDTYDFENRLVRRTRADGATIHLNYDADGIRIQKVSMDASAALVSVTNYLVDINNLTGYAQVFEERTTEFGLGGTSTVSCVKTYTYGSDLISQSVVSGPSSLVTRYYAYDGHGSVRELTDATGAVTDRYDYDAFGNLTFSSGTTANAYLYCGEQWDSDLALYFLRARFMNPDSGRFWNADAYEGNRKDSISLHRYLYASANPVSGIDPTGLTTYMEVIGVQIAEKPLRTISIPSAVAAIGKVSGTIVTAVIVSGGAIAAGELIHQVQVTQALTKARTLIRTKVEEKRRRRGCGQVLFHYTDYAGMIGIVTSSTIISTTGYSTFFPPGAYGTTIPPWAIDMTQAALSALFRGGFEDYPFTHFVAFCGPDFSIIPGTLQWWRPAPPLTPVPIVVLTHGENLMPRR